MSEWTLETLKAHLDARLAAEVELRRARREDDLRAIEKSEETMNLRLENMNQFRAQILEERGRFVTNVFAQEQLKARAIRDEGTDKRFNRIENLQSKLIGGLVLATFIAPLLTGLIVYLLTRTAIPVNP